MKQKLIGLFLLGLMLGLCANAFAKLVPGQNAVVASYFAVNPMTIEYEYCDGSGHCVYENNLAQIVKDHHYKVTLPAYYTDTDLQRTYYLTIASAKYDNLTNQYGMNCTGYGYNLIKLTVDQEHQYIVCDSHFSVI